MAESPSSLSTSEKPPIEKPGLGLLIPDTTPSDPITADQSHEIEPSDSSQNVGSIAPMPEVVVKEIVPAVEEEAEEEEKLRDAIEREICSLSIEQAEIEAAYERLEALDDAEEVHDAKSIKVSLDEENKEEGVSSVEEENVDEGNREGKDVERSKSSDHLDDEMNEKDSLSGEEENEVDGENTGGQTGEGAASKSGKYNPSNNRRKNNYPMRPDAEDCAFYMKFGSCKFGLNCKFNHPPRRKNQAVKDKAKHREENLERTGQTECKYYLTSGGCKFGKDCKYTHGSEKSSIPRAAEFNFLGLPIRQGEKECPYYMRTGSCKYGSNCRFHHPDPTAVAGGDSSPGYGNGGGSLPTQLVSSSSVSSWSSPRAYTETSPFVPVIFPPNQGPRTQNPEWNGYQAAVYPTSERSLPTPPAFAINNLPTDINFPMPHHNNMLVEEYPERPGEPECSFFLKTGDCKYKSNCKFHHPKTRHSKAKSNSFALSDKGLPLRPDQPICTHYHRYGICKYGPGCKYDHPSNFAILPAPFDHQPPFGNGVGRLNETGSSV